MTYPHPHRVVVTGMGQVSALGIDPASFSQRLFAGEPNVSRIEGLGAPGLDHPIGAKIPGWDPKLWLTPRQIQATSPVAQYAYAAASQAFEAARLDRSDRPRGGVFVGSGFGGLVTAEDTYRSCFTNPGMRPKPSAIPMAMANAASGFCSIYSASCPACCLSAVSVFAESFSS